MKDHALEIASRQQDPLMKLNVLREYLQTYALRTLFERNFFRTAAFMEGTCLRLVHDLPRYSDNLHFSLLESDSSFSIAPFARTIREEFILAGYDVDATVNDRKTVNHAFFRFSGIMQEAGVSTIAGQKLSIRIEVDKHPPPGAVVETGLLIRYFPISFSVYDIPSLFAGKVTAIACRRFTKGRDFFDLGWYLGKWKGLTPNTPLLRAGLKQMEWQGPMPDENTWREFLRDMVARADWKSVEDDVRRLLINPLDMKILSRENILNLLRNNLG